MNSGQIRAKGIVEGFVTAYIRMTSTQIRLLPIRRPDEQCSHRPNGFGRVDLALIDNVTAVAAVAKRSTLLREYRTRLIADVVTGKLDVREAAARLPDEVEEPEPLDQADTLIGGDGRTRRRPRHHPRGGCGVTTDISERGLERLICTASDR